ncbi:unnamed protein product [Sympodiomycopsis kandeliae]
MPSSPRMRIESIPTRRSSNHVSGSTTSSSSKSTPQQLAVNSHANVHANINANMNAGTSSSSYPKSSSPPNKSSPLGIPSSSSTKMLSHKDSFGGDLPPSTSTSKMRFTSQYPINEYQLDDEISTPTQEDSDPDREDSTDDLERMRNSSFQHDASIQGHNASTSQSSTSSSGMLTSPSKRRVVMVPQQQQRQPQPQPQPTLLSSSSSFRRPIATTSTSSNNASNNTSTGSTAAGVNSPMTGQLMSSPMASSSAGVNSPLMTGSSKNTGPSAANTGATANNNTAQRSESTTRSANTSTPTPTSTSTSTPTPTPTPTPTINTLTTDSIVAGSALPSGDSNMKSLGSSLPTGDSNIKSLGSSLPTGDSNSKSLAGTSSHNTRSTTTAGHHSSSHHHHHHHNPRLTQPKLPRAQVDPAPPPSMYWSRAPIHGSVPRRVFRAHTATLCEDTMWLFGGCDSKGCFGSIWCFDVETMCWSKPRVNGDVPSPRRAHSATMIDRRLYVFGGGDGPQYYSDLYCFDTVSLKWSKPEVYGSEQPSPRRAHSANYWNGHIVIFGGGNGIGALSDVWMLDVRCATRLEWKKMPCSGKPPIGRGYHTGNIVDDKLIIIGGSDGHMSFNDVHILRLDTQVWYQVRTDEVHCRVGHSSTQVGSYLFLFGGHDSVGYSNELLTLNLVNLQWENRKICGQKPKGRGYHQAWLCDSRLFIHAGFDGSTIFDDLYFLDLAACSYLPQITQFSIVLDDDDDDDDDQEGDEEEQDEGEGGGTGLGIYSNNNTTAEQGQRNATTTTTNSAGRGGGLSGMILPSHHNHNNDGSGNARGIVRRAV